MTEDIPKALDAIPEQWIPIALILMFCGVVIWGVIKIALKQHDVISKKVDHGELIYDISASVKSISRIVTATHSIISGRKSNDS